jgi:hypothetical protein
MNKELAVAKLRLKIEEWIATIDGRDLQTAIRNNYCLAGGAIVSTLNDEEPNDYDIWFSDINIPAALVRYYSTLFEPNTQWLDKLEFMHENRTYWIEHINDELVKTISYSALSLQNGIQIIYKKIAKPEDVIADFDFQHNKMYVTNDSFFIPPETVELCKDKKLCYESSTMALHTLMRVVKYTNRGWKIDYPNMFKIVNTVLSLPKEELEKQREYVTVSSSGESVE